MWKVPESPGVAVHEYTPALAAVALKNTLVAKKNAIQKAKANPGPLGTAQKTAKGVCPARLQGFWL